MRAKLKMIKEEMWRRMHQPIPVQGKWLWYVGAIVVECRSKPDKMTYRSCKRQIDIQGAVGP